MVTGPIGFFGKLPSKGDFVSSNLPSSFVHPWDAWLRLTLVHSRERLGDRSSRTAFLLSPVWRFILAPGCCGPQGWAGVVASSIDRIGRIYPLTLAARMDDDEYPVRLMQGWGSGFERLIDLALTMVREEDSLDHVDEALQLILRDWPSIDATPPIAASVGGAALGLAPGDALSFTVTTSAGEAEFARACAAAIARAGDNFSLMWQDGWGLPPRAIIGSGLPDTARIASIWEPAAAVA